MNPATKRHGGFTLVELLVVIVIIAVLASLSFMMVSRGLKKAESVKIASNMRQIGAMLGAYAADNGNRFPPPRADVTEGADTKEGDHWHQALFRMMTPGLDDSVWLHNTEYWKEHQKEIVLVHPAADENMKPAAFAHWNPGFAMNRQIVANLQPDGINHGSWSPGENGPQTYGIPLNVIREPARTPIIAPRGDWHYTYSPTEIKERGLDQLLVDGKAPILFIDGHIESMPLQEYVDRKLHEMPRKK